MHLGKSVKLRFSAAWITYLTKRVYNRLKHHNATPESKRKSVSKQHQNWSQCLENNKGKLLSRVASDSEVSQSNSRWHGCYTFQKLKMETRLDTYERWRRLEYRLLEKINKTGFVYAREVSSGWTLNVKNQINKVNSTFPGLRCEPQRLRTKWSGVIKAFRTRVYAQRLPLESSWDYSTRAATLRVNLLLAPTKWTSAINHNRTKLKLLLVPSMRP